MEDSDIDVLRGVVRKLTPLDRDSVRFPQFLELMKVLTEENLFSLNENVQKTLRREQELQRFEAATAMQPRRNRRASTTSGDGGGGRLFSLMPSIPVETAKRKAATRRVTVDLRSEYDSEREGFTSERSEGSKRSE